MWVSKTINQARDDFGKRADELNARIEETTEILSLTLVVVASIAALALVIALTVEARHS